MVELDGLLFLDEHLVVVNKPSGELVVPGWARGEATTMTRVRDALGRWVYPVHRLDRGTSGAVVLALSRDDAAHLSASWSAVEKRYVALARGRFPLHEVHVDHPVRKGEQGTERVEAVTDLRGVAHSPRDRCSLVEAWPRTGRLHQIRRHLKHLSHPILGDVNYGDGRENRRYRSAWALHRLALHAAQLWLPHPKTGEVLELWAPLPPELVDVWEALELPIEDLRSDR